MYCYHYNARILQYNNDIGVMDGILSRSEPIKNFNDYQEAKSVIIEDYKRQSDNKSANIRINIDSLSLIWKD